MGRKLPFGFSHCYTMNMSRRRVALVVGGESGEFEISMLSGAEVVAALDPKLWDPFVIRIEQDGAWCFPAGTDVNGPAERLGVGDGVNALLAGQPDVVFPVMHGPYGEDGRFQALCELLHLPYVGSNPGSSSLAMHKARARDVLAAAGLNVAPAQELSRGDALRIKAPCVVKPMRLGSSVGLMVVETEAALHDALADAFDHDECVLVETFVSGTELTAGILEEPDGSLLALPLVEIRPLTSHFFDYKAKYTPGATDEICPAPVSEELTARVQAVGQRAHRALGCRGMSRTDVIVDADGVIWVLETNTIPGMTQTSLLPQAAAEAGITFAALQTRLLQSALVEGP